MYPQSFHTCISIPKVHSLTYLVITREMMSTLMHKMCSKCLIWNAKNTTAIFFSGQALCGQCREETHRAKMFSQHDIIHISMKAKKLNSKVRKFRIDA